jgi:hypothetical protein
VAGHMLAAADAASYSHWPLRPQRHARPLLSTGHTDQITGTTGGMVNETQLNNCMHAWLLDGVLRNGAHSTPPATH